MNREIPVPDWGKEARKAMIDQDLTVVQLSRDLGMARQYVSAVLNGRVISPKVQKAICQRLGIEAAS